MKAIAGSDGGPDWIPCRQMSGYLCATIAIAGSSLFAACHLATGWIPHDEGQLGQTAERELQGEMPHRDFDEMYTGGVTYLHALAFQLFGIRTEATHWMLWMFFVPFTASVYWTARRVERPWPAVLVTALCGAITTPVLGGALPGWYNLFLAVYALVCLLKFLDSDHRRWLFAAGLIIGCTLLVKVTGLYVLAAAILFLVNHEQLLKSSKHVTRNLGFNQSPGASSRFPKTPVASAMRLIELGRKTLGDLLSRTDSLTFKCFVLACLASFACLKMMFSPLAAAAGVGAGGGDRDDYHSVDKAADTRLMYWMLYSIGHV